MLSYFMTLFVGILNQSLVASLVIVGVCLARLLLRTAPKRFSYALWAVVLLRLLCPFSLESSYSLIPCTSTPLSQVQLVTNEMQSTTAPPPTQATDTENTDSIITMPTRPETTDFAVNAPMGDIANHPTDTTDNLTDIANHPTDTTDNPTNTAHTAPTTAQWARWFVLLGGIWLGGVICLVGYSLLSLAILRQKVQYATTQDQQVYHSEHLETAFVLGVLRPKIYLPATLSDMEQRYILLHEQTHLRRGDHIMRLIAFFALALHWFNPLVWVAFYLSGKDMEMACDETVIQSLGADVKQSYSASLLSLATGRKIVGGTPLAFGAGDTKSRIKHVLSYRKPTLWVMLLGVLLLGAVLFASLFTARTPLDPDAPYTLQVNWEHAHTDQYESLQPLITPCVEEMVRTLNATGTDGTSAQPYTVEFVLATPTALSLGTVSENFGMLMYRLDYAVTLTTNEQITLPEGYQFTETGAVQATATHTPYLFVYLEYQEETCLLQPIGVLSYDALERLYGGPAKLSEYDGDLFLASAMSIWDDYDDETLDFGIFQFAVIDHVVRPEPLPQATATPTPMPTPMNAETLAARARGQEIWDAFSPTYAKWYDYWCMKGLAYGDGFIDQSRAVSFYPMHHWETGEVLSTVEELFPYVESVCAPTVAAQMEQDILDNMAEQGTILYYQEIDGILYASVGDPPRIALQNDTAQCMIETDDYTVIRVECTPSENDPNTQCWAEIALQSLDGNWYLLATRYVYEQYVYEQNDATKLAPYAEWLAAY